jgi:hypothetical protein
MRILVLSWYFPPINQIGAVRAGKLVEYLHDRGHELWVVTARRDYPDLSLPLDFPSERVIRTGWIDFDRLGAPWDLIRRRAINSRREPSAAADEGDRTGSSVRERIAFHYWWLVHFPDRQGGWLPFLRRAAARLLKQQAFDLIYASGPPFTTFVAAAHLSQRFDVPWIAEYRDGWSRYHYTPKPEWRERIDSFLENRVTASAAGIVAVTEPWAEFYEQQFRKPTIAIYNGFDPAQIPVRPALPRPGLPVTIVHMGTVYSGLRDPAVLFEAIKLAGLTPQEVEVGFYGAASQSVLPLAAKFGVQDFVKVPPRVPYDRALEIQRTSDILLLLQSPADLANVPAKTFEYFAARRPILGLGLDEGIPAKLVRDRNAGCYVTDSRLVAEQLKSWVDQKRHNGVIPCTPESALAGLTRAEQFSRLESFLGPLARPHAKASFGAVALSRAEKTKIESLAPEPSPRPSNMLPADSSAIIDLSALEKPQLLVIVDAEEEFDWGKPFSANNSSVTSMRRQHLGQEIFARYGIVPTYAVDYVVADQEDGYEPLLDFLRDGVCEIGSQLHPWVTPPKVEELGERNSFAGNLPEELEFEKLKNLTERIKANLGVRPELYRAGRYGTGPNTPRFLKRLGYTIDCSVLPHTRRLSPYAPDYIGAPVTPYWIGSGTDLLELPVTKTTIGLAHRAVRDLAPYVFSARARSLRMPAVMARLRLLDEVRLSPEGSTLNEAKRLTRFLLAEGQKIFVVSYHSPSLGIGHTPYVRNAHDLAKFLGWLEGYCDFFFGQVQGVASTPRKIRWLALAASAGPYAVSANAADSARAEA